MSNLQALAVQFNSGYRSNSCPASLILLCRAFKSFVKFVFFAPQVNMDVECRIVQDMLKGDDCYELRMRLKEHKDEKFPYTEDD